MSTIIDPHDFRSQKGKLIFAIQEIEVSGSEGRTVEYKLLVLLEGKALDFRVGDHGGDGSLLVHVNIFTFDAQLFGDLFDRNTELVIIVLPTI